MVIMTCPSECRHKVFVFHPEQSLWDQLMAWDRTYQRDATIICDLRPHFRTLHGQPEPSAVIVDATRQQRRSSRITCGLCRMLDHTSVIVYVESCDASFERAVRGYGAMFLCGPITSECWDVIFGHAVEMAAVRDTLSPFFCRAQSGGSPVGPVPVQKSETDCEIRHKSIQ